MSLAQALRGGAATAALLLAAGGAQAQSPDVQMLQQQIQQLQQQLQSLQSQVSAQARAQQQQQQAAPVAATAAAPGPHVTQTPGNRFGLESADGQYSIALTGRLHFDAGDYIGYNKNSKATTPTNLQSGFNARRARLGVTGKFAGDWGYNFIYDFGGSNDTGAGGFNGGGIEIASITYNGLNRGPLPLAFDVGYQDTPFTLDEATSSNDIMFMERASAGAVASNIFANDNRASADVRSNSDRYWAGLYLTGSQSGAAHTGAGTSQQLGAFGRFTYQILQAPDYSLHFGVDAGGLLKPAQSGGVETATLSDRPELRIDTASILSTGSLGTLLTARNTPVTGAGVYGLEAAGGWRNFFAQSEAYEIEIDRGGVPADHFRGGYLEGSWTATGEARKYIPATGAYSGINPSHPFSLSAGTWGAFEFAGRVSFVDLNDNFAPNHTGAMPLYNGVSGGRQLIYTAGINWYLNPNMRFMLNYLHGYVKKEATTATAGAPETGADFDAVAMRAQVAF